jgi:hypothetical protein
MQAVPFAIHVSALAHRPISPHLSYGAMLLARAKSISKALSLQVFFLPFTVLRSPGPKLSGCFVSLRRDLISLFPEVIQLIIVQWLLIKPYLGDETGHRW